jgi:adenylate kinase
LKQDKKLYIIILGAPGAGKGTQAASIAGELKLAHVASGDLFRQAVERGDELGARVKGYMDKGVLVPDEITIAVIMDRLSAPDCRNGAVLDGFPRNIKQARALDAALKKQNKAVDKALYLEVPEEELVRRLSGRRVCRNCQTPYQVYSSPAEIGNRCQRCGGELYQRPDDRAETVKKRLGVYFSQTAPLIDYYRKQGKLLAVDGEGSVDEVTERIIGALRKLELTVK